MNTIRATDFLCTSLYVAADDCMACSVVGKQSYVLVCIELLEQLYCYTRRDGFTNVVGGLLTVPVAPPREHPAENALSAASSRRLRSFRTVCRPTLGDKRLCSEPARHSSPPRMLYSGSRAEKEMPVSFNSSKTIGQLRLSNPSRHSTEEPRVEYSTVLASIDDSVFIARQHAMNTERNIVVPIPSVSPVSSV